MEHIAEYVFGLDIGTRSIVGTVGKRNDVGQFMVSAQVSKEHETRAVIDGQIHDIPTVAKTIREIKGELEQITGMVLQDVCIAAAGRVLKTKRVHAEHEFATETKVTEEHIRSLDLLGVEQAYDLIREDVKDESTKFYCVGYTTVEYFLNGYSMASIEMHKATCIGVDLVATFLPDEVVDGLYTSVEEAGLHVASMTLEPIAAIQVAIPENFRLLNIALVDVGAGTSDISIVKDGSIVAFGMMPLAGDEITEAIARNYLVDFQTAEKVKKNAMRRKQVSFKNIMGETVKVTSEEVLQAVQEAVSEITGKISDKIIELNGGKTVSAVFVVGGGGKLKGFVETMASHLQLPKNRVAIRGAEVLREVIFAQKEIKKDSTLVTPVGICLNYYEQKSNFIHVMVNDERVKLYDNSKLTVLDAALQAGYRKEELFPERGHSLHYFLNGKKQEAKGRLGEAAEIYIGEDSTGLNTKIGDKDVIHIKPATRGEPGRVQLNELEECRKEISLQVCGKVVLCPREILVDGRPASVFYEVKEGDRVDVSDSSNLGQVLDFLGMDKERKMSVNGRQAELSDKVFDHGVIEFMMEDTIEGESAVTQEQRKSQGVTVRVNGTEVLLPEKENHIFVDVFDVYSFDLTKAGNKRLISKVNGVPADFTVPIKQGDEIELVWE